MFSPPTLLVAHPGVSNPFLTWLKKLGLEDLLKTYSLQTLADWGWLVPQYRVLFPTRFFDEWDNYPFSPWKCPEDLADYATLWDYSWHIDDESDRLWFLDPVFQTDHPVGKLFQGFRQTNTLSLPDPISHARGLTIEPYADYYYRWQGYALVDLMRFADCIMPVYQTPDVIERAQAVLRIAKEVREHQPMWPKEILDAPNRWAGLAEPMTWLAHFRAFRSAVFCFGDTDSHVLRERYERGARELAAHFGVSEVLLEKVIKDKLLVLAGDWMRANRKMDNRSLWTRRAWPYLREEIQLAVQWLSILSGKPFLYYVDQWQKPNFGNVEWATLDEVLPYAFLQHQKKFSELVGQYLNSFNELRGKRQVLPNDKIAKLCRHLQATNPAFSGFLSAFYELHEHLSNKPFDEHGIDFRSRRPLDHFAMLAIHAEGCLRRELDALGVLENIEPQHQTISRYIQELAIIRQVPTKISGTFDTQRSLADLKKDRRDPIGRIQSLESRLPEQQRQLVQAFLCCVLARNYFAHHDFLDNELLYTSRAQFLLRGILLTVLTLLNSGNVENSDASGRE